MEISLSTWIITDTHFGHRNIVKYCNRPYNHNTLMLNNWKSVVKESDKVFHLGDVCLWYGREQRYWETVAKRLPGEKYLLIGNHDERPPMFYTKNMGYTVVEPFVWEGYLFTHGPAYPGDYTKESWHTNIHGHIHTHRHRVDALIFDRTYINVSIEHMGYKPHTLGSILANELGVVTVT